MGERLLLCMAHQTDCYHLQILFYMFLYFFATQKEIKLPPNFKSLPYIPYVLVI